MNIKREQSKTDAVIARAISHAFDRNGANLAAYFDDVRKTYNLIPLEDDDSSFTSTTRTKFGLSAKSK